MTFRASGTSAGVIAGAAVGGAAAVALLGVAFMKRGAISAALGSKSEATALLGESTAAPATYGAS